MHPPGPRSIGGRRTTPGTITHSARPAAALLAASSAPSSARPGSLRSRFRSRRSALAHARALLSGLTSRCPLAFLGSEATILDPPSSCRAQLPSRLGSSHELSLGSWPGLRERRQEVRAAAFGDVTPMGLGIQGPGPRGGKETVSLELHPQLGDLKAPQAPCSCSRLAALAHRLGLWQRWWWGCGAAEAIQRVCSGPPGRTDLRYSRDPSAPTQVLSGLGRQSLLPFPLNPPRPGQP